MTDAPRRILNLGCGNQTFGTHRVDFCATDTTTHVFDVERGLQFPDGFFDEVYERNLFEHLKNPNFHLTEVYRVLKPKGTLTLITDNASCIRYYLLRTHTGGYVGHRHLFTATSDRHYAIFTKEHLKNHLLSAGFEVVSIGFVETDYATRFIDKLARKVVPSALKSLTYPRICAVAQRK